MKLAIEIERGLKAQVIEAVTLTELQRQRLYSAINALTAELVDGNEDELLSTANINNYLSVIASSGGIAHNKLLEMLRNAIMSATSKVLISIL